MEVRRGAGMQPVAGDDERGARLDKTIDTPGTSDSFVHYGVSMKWDILRTSKLTCARVEEL